MPEGLPEAFGVRLTQENNAQNVAFYLRPVNGYGNGMKYDGSFTTSGQGPWDIQNYFFNEDHNTYPNYGEGAIDKLDRNNNSYRSLRWAVDVRPYNFEEFFTGFFKDADQKVIDKDYNFVFEGAGGYKRGTTDTEEMLADNAISVYRDNMIKTVNGNYLYSGYQPIYKGLDNTRTLKSDLKPTYYLPFVNYKMIEKYPDATKKLAVKAGYTYHDINFTIDKATGAVSGTDYQIEPCYFDKDGNKVEKAEDAAFQCYFKCAIDLTFNGKFYIKTDTTNATGFGIPGLKPNTYANLQGIGETAGKPIPYGTKFSIYVDSLNLKWKSTLATLPHNVTDADANKYFGASYFMTAFESFTTKYTEVDAQGQSFYVDTLAVNTPFDSNLYRVDDGSVTRNAVKYLKLVDLADPYITKVEIYNEGNTAVEKTLTKDGTGDNSLDRFSDYFDVALISANNSGKYGLTFIPNTTTLNPNKLGQMIIYLKNDAKAVHQWGHTAGFNSDDVKIYIGNPNSTPHINSARRAR
jgi:hypothetical protein